MEDSKKIDDTIAKALGIPSLEEISNTEIIEIEDSDLEILEPENNIQSEILKIDSNEKEFIDDIDMAKRNIKNLLSDGHTAFGNLILIAMQTENPRAFEVASKLLSDLVSANKEMVNVSEKKLNSKNSKTQNITNNTTNNLVLSTTDILKLLKSDKK